MRAQIREGKAFACRRGSGTDALDLCPREAPCRGAAWSAMSPAPPSSCCPHREQPLLSLTSTNKNINAGPTVQPSPCTRSRPQAPQSAALSPNSGSLPLSPDSKCCMLAHGELFMNLKTVCGCDIYSFDRQKYHNALGKNEAREGVSWCCPKSINKHSGYSRAGGTVHNPSIPGG